MIIIVAISLRTVRPSACVVAGTLWAPVVVPPAMSVRQAREQGWKAGRLPGSAVAVEAKEIPIGGSQSRATVVQPQPPSSGLLGRRLQPVTRPACLPPMNCGRRLSATRAVYTISQPVPCIYSGHFSTGPGTERDISQALYRRMEVTARSYTNLFRDKCTPRRPGPVPAGVQSG